jgi:fluoride exporter
MAYLWVALGGAFGSMARYGVSVAAARLWGSAFPWGTVLVNVVGSFIISFFGALTLPHGPHPVTPDLRTFVMVGFCGGFTTFSSFSLQTLELAQGKEWLGALANVALSVALCLASVAAGHYAAIGLSPSSRLEP